MAKKPRKLAASRSTGSAVKLNRPRQQDDGRTGRPGRPHRRRRASKSRDPYLDIPARALSNVRYNKSKGFIEMGSNKNRRQLFNLSQAKSYMQTVLVASGCKQLLEQQKTTSIRGLFYLLKHTIEGTKEETFDDAGRMRSGDRRPGSDAQLAARRAARLRLEPRRAGRADHAHRRRRRNRLRPHGLRRLQHSLDRRARGDAVQEERGRIHPARRKRHGLAAVQRGQVLAQAQLHPDRTAAASPRAASGGCCTGCTTN